MHKDKYITLCIIVMDVTLDLCYNTCESWRRNLFSWACNGGEIMAEKKTPQKRIDYLVNYQKEKLKRIPLDVSKEFYETLKSHCDALGLPVNRFIKEAIQERMERDKADTNDSGA